MDYARRFGITREDTTGHSTAITRGSKDTVGPLCK